MCVVFKNVLWNNKAPNEQRNNSGGEKKMNNNTKWSPQ